MQVGDGGIIRFAQAQAEHAHDLVGQGGALLQQHIEVRTGHLEKAHRGVRPHARRSQPVGIEQAHLTEEVAGAAHGQQTLVGGAQRLENLHLAVNDDGETGTRLAFPEKKCASRNLDLAQHFCEELGLGAAQRGEKRDLPDERNLVSAH